MSLFFICIIVLGILLTLSKFAIDLYLQFKTSEELPNDDSQSSVQLSIHIPTRAEPFEVVKNCIDSILPQLEPYDEIIIIDNNHTNKEDYLPLQDYCEKHDIKFEHHDYIPGFKAGALNKALQLTSPNTTNILIVDCDYVLTSHAIPIIKDASCKHSNHAFVQFPQAYFINKKVDVNNELTKYFSYNLMFNRYHALGTGTLCCIKISTLQEIDGWPTDSITEDALLGLKVQNVDNTGIYIPEKVGRGYLPISIQDFYNQRKRWIYGNAEVLIKMLKHPNLYKITIRNISQLATWLNFSALTLLIHLILIVLAILSIDVRDILLFVYLHYSILFLIKLYEFNQLPIELGRRIKSFLIQWQFLVVSATHWLPVLFNKSKEFVRTPKLVSLKSSTLRVPIFFLLLNIVTLATFWNYTSIVLLSAFFIIIELLAIRVLKSNFN